ncbi:MAG: penicillin-binding transpeptidase domain-containing protein [Pseudomonadota bacterium]
MPWRFYLVIASILLIIFGLVARVVDLTVIDRVFLQHEGDARVLRTLNMPAFRGMITDRNGYPLAVSTSVFSIWMNPQEFLSTPENIDILSRTLDVNSSIILAQLAAHKTKGREFIYIKRGVQPDLANAVKKLDLPGVYLQEEYKRYYPEGEVSAHLIGFTNIDDKGQEGLELIYNDWLTGTRGIKKVIKDRLGRSVSDVKMIQQQHPGKDLMLSMDRRIQYLAYRELMAGIKENVAVSGSVVVMDVKTGEVLAMVNQPSYNPNNRAERLNDVYRNRAVTDSFEPGSTIKAFSIASALDSGLYKPDTVIDTSPGWLNVDRHLVRDEHNNGLINLAQILQVSSNVGTTKVILSLPPNQLWSLLHRVGFGETTGIGFPGEQAGSLVQRPKWSPFVLATLAFGYGISATPIQLAQAYAIFANAGVKVPVSLLRVDNPPAGETVLKPEVARQMMALLETVTSTKGATGQLARVPGYRVAGKTGTAVMAGPHGYQKHHYTSTFVGIAPVSNPRLVVAVVIHDPQGQHYYASFVSAPVFQKIMEGTLRILNISPDDPQSL